APDGTAERWLQTALRDATAAERAGDIRPLRSPRRAPRRRLPPLRLLIPATLVALLLVSTTFAAIYRAVRAHHAPQATAVKPALPTRPRVAPVEPSARTAAEPVPPAPPPASDKRPPVRHRRVAVAVQLPLSPPSWPDAGRAAQPAVAPPSGGTSEAHLIAQ